MNRIINAVLEKQLGYQNDMCGLKKSQHTASKHAYCILFMSAEKCEEIPKKAVTSELKALKLMHPIAKYNIN